MSNPNPHDFLYFDDLPSLAAWRPENALSHPTNISNTPLQPRGIKSPTKDGLIPSLIFCHDFQGSYLPSERSQGLFHLPAGSPRPYTAEHLHLTTTFIYFSHRLVTIPPAPWINTCHRNGTKVLGTFLVEGNSPHVPHILDRGTEGEFFYAVLLRGIAKAYGFDGWLLNFESAFPRNQFKPSYIQKFISEIKTDGLDVIWYDALTLMNQVHYQNALTLLNAPYFWKATGIFTNYFWREPHILATQAFASAPVVDRLQDVFIGVDCYGRGSLGGGGWGVGEALERIKRTGGAAAAMFAPGWTWENFDGKDFEKNDQRFWNIVGQYAGTHAAGTVSTLYTTFNRGFGESWWVKGKKFLGSPWTHLGAQSILPNVEGQRIQWDSTTAWMGGWSLKFPNATSTELASSNPAGRLLTDKMALFQTSIKCTQETKVQVRWTGNPKEWALYTTLLSPSGERTSVTRKFERTNSEEWQLETLSCPTNGHIAEIGLQHTPGAGSSGDAFWLGELSVVQSAVRVSSAEVGGIVFDTEKKLLSWNVWNGNAGLSAVTRDFAYFIVYAGERMLGLAYACTFHVPEGTQGGGWRIEGVTWEGAVKSFPKPSEVDRVGARLEEIM